MYAIQGNSIIEVEVKSVLSIGKITDSRIARIEALVAGNYSVSVHTLNYIVDTPAKVMCCFLLHDMFNYSIASLAVKYRINRLFLRKKITEVYITCLQNEAELHSVIALRSAFFITSKAQAN